MESNNTIFSKEMAEDIKQVSEQEWLEYINKMAKIKPLKRALKKQYRNNLCACGSGKKVKRCCGTNVEYII